jgi:primosomal protein N' (replication factor Y)
MPIARILFPIALPEPFDYAVPEDMEVQAGSYVMAPLGKTTRTAVVWEVVADEVGEGRTLKSVAHVYDVPPMSPAMRKFIAFTAHYTVAAPGAVLAMALRAKGGLNPSPRETVYHLTGDAPERLTPAREKALDAARALCPAGASQIATEAGVSNAVVGGLAKAGALRAERQAIDRPFPVPNGKLPSKNLTPEQSAAADQLRAGVRSAAYAPFLLDGVTGSGKTEVYFEAIAEALERDPAAQILVLLPEIALTQAVLDRFTDRFGAPPAPWHSGLSQKERRRTWREAAHGRARIVIGARSALFLPYQKLALIIVDEEHDGSYKQGDGVIYHARDLAVMRAKLESGSVVLASATPALETATNAEAGRYNVLKLAARPGVARLPDVELVDLKTDSLPLPCARRLRVASKRFYSLIGVGMPLL